MQHNREKARIFAKGKSITTKELADKINKVE